jgi:hypothetical protein
MIDIDWLIRIFFYGWAIYEIGSLFSAFSLVKEKYKVRYYMYLTATLLALTLSFMSISTLTILMPKLHWIWKMAVIFPLIFVALVSRKLRNSLK